jgi:hypothetical protein
MHEFRAIPPVSGQHRQFPGPHADHPPAGDKIPPETQQTNGQNGRVHNRQQGCILRHIGTRCRHHAWQAKRHHAARQAVRRDHRMHDPRALRQTVGAIGITRNHNAVAATWARPIRLTGQGRGQATHAPAANILRQLPPEPVPQLQRRRLYTNHAAL